MFLRDLIDTTNVYLQMIEKYCQGSIMVQSRVKSQKPKKPSKIKAPKEKVKKNKEEKKKASREEVMVRFLLICNFINYKLILNARKSSKTIGIQKFHQTCRLFS